MKKTLQLIISIMACATVHAQVTVVQRTTAISLMHQIMTIKNYSYKYKVSAVFPDGTKKQFDGNSFVSAQLKSVFSNTGVSTLLLTPDWYLQADHEAKRVSVMNLSAYFSKQDAGNQQVDLFNKNAIGVYMDSLVIKYGKVESFTENSSGEVAFKIGFPAASYLKKMEVVYDQKAKIPVKVLIEAFYEEPGKDPRTGLKRGTYKQVYCEQYSYTIPVKVFRTDQFFTVSKGKVIMRQFKNYKLSTLL